MKNINIDLKNLAYQYPIRMKNFSRGSYLIYNEETSAHLHLKPYCSICFVDDAGNHFLCGPKLTRIKTDEQDISLMLGEGIYLPSLGIHYITLTWSEVYKMALEYFTIFT